MFYFPIEKTGSDALLTAATSGAWTYSDVVDLSGKKYDERYLSLSLNIASAGITPYLHLGYQSAPTRGATFRVVGSGSSSIFMNTTTGSPAGDNKYYFPLLISHSGSTYQLTNPGCFKLGYRSVRGSVSQVSFTAQLVLG